MQINFLMIKLKHWLNTMNNKMCKKKKKLINKTIKLREEKMIINVNKNSSKVKISIKEKWIKTKKLTNKILNKHNNNNKTQDLNTV